MRGSKHKGTRGFIKLFADSKISQKGISSGRTLSLKPLSGRVGQDSAGSCAKTLARLFCQQITARFYRTSPNRNVGVVSVFSNQANYHIGREELGIASTVIPVKPRHRNADTVHGFYRKQMHHQSGKQTFDNHRQVENTFWRFKRQRRYALRTTTDGSCIVPRLMRILTYNLMFLVIGLLDYKYAFFDMISIEQLHT